MSWQDPLISPSDPGAVFACVNQLVSQQRFAEAIPVAETAAKASPDNQQFRDLLEALKKKGQGK